jgi:hypothetical protein
VSAYPVSDLADLDDVSDGQECTAVPVNGFLDPATCNGCLECVRALAAELELSLSYRPA